MGRIEKTDSLAGWAWAWAIAMAVPTQWAVSKRAGQAFALKHRPIVNSSALGSALGGALPKGYDAIFRVCRDRKQPCQAVNDRRFAGHRQNA